MGFPCYGFRVVPGWTAGGMRAMGLGWSIKCKNALRREEKLAIEATRRETATGLPDGKLIGASAGSLSRPVVYKHQP